MEETSRSQPDGSYSNGNHHNHDGVTQRDHFRSRKSGGGGGRSRGDISAPPCTDFDKAYFQSYSHVGIHEEMIKVTDFVFDILLCIVDFVLFFVFEFWFNCKLFTVEMTD